MGGTLLIVDSITTSVRDPRMAESSRLGGSSVAVAGPVPNPAADRSTVGYRLQERSRVRIAVVDMVGNVVQSTDEGTVEPGRHEVALSIGGLTDGIYFVRVAATGDNGKNGKNGKNGGKNGKNGESVANTILHVLH